MEAIAHLNEGLQALAHWPKRAPTFGIEIELQLHLAMSYIGLEGWSAGIPTPPIGARSS